MRKYTHVIVYEENGERKEVQASCRPSRAKKKLKMYVAKNGRIERRELPKVK